MQDFVHQQQDAKPPTNKIREKLEKAHIDFEDL